MGSDPLCCEGFLPPSTPTKPPKISFILEESEVMEFQWSRLEKEMESMKEEFRKELDALKYDIHSLRKNF